jgi:hypothetical protein
LLPPVHTLLQPPQLSSSVWVSKHDPSHRSCPELQAHTPPKHEESPRHATPHAPQLLLSQQVETHPPAQTTWPGGQLVVHCPMEQSSPGPHAWPHAPQLVALEVTSTQKPEQLVVPGAQVQAPPAQNAPPVHTFPHSPQFAELVSRDTHAPAHSVVPGPQLDAHVPALQTVPFGQAAVQAPQCWGSVLSAMQTLPQLLIPAEHWQLPATQVDPPAHAVPQLPQ